MAGFQRRALITTFGVLMALLATQARADQYTVAATTDVWLAGQPNGSSVSGYFGTDTAPGNSPVGVSVAGGQVLTFSITGYTKVSVDGSCFDSTADGGVCYQDEFTDSPDPANGISLAHVAAGALVGVFVPTGGPSGSTPAALDFTSGGLGTSFSTLAPALDQLFFIGDGLTGTGTGAVQQFTAPVGAGMLYLAISDSVGASANNSGSISVDVANAAAVPEPGTLFCVAAGLAMSGLARRRARAPRR